MVYTKLISILVVILGICLISISAWTDGDAMMDIDNNRANYTGTWGIQQRKYFTMVTITDMHGVLGEIVLMQQPRQPL